MVTLKELRKQKKLTQVDCANYLEIPLRTYQSYEANPGKNTSMKYIFMMQKLEQYGYVDEEHGVLSIDEIKNLCTDVFSEFDVEYCYLFGSYAKGKATEKSDVDLLVSTDVSGMCFYDLVEALRERLKKKVDVLKLEQVNDNNALLNDILKDGIKIYG